MLATSMLDYFAIGNFKSFGSAQLVHFKPITLLFGANSAGKSSFLQALLLLKHALETGSFDAHKVISGGDHVNLGGIMHMLHQHNAMQDISLMVGIRPDSTPSDAFPMGSPAIELRLQVGLEGESEVNLPDMKRGGLTAAEVHVDGALFGAFHVTGQINRADATRYGIKRIVQTRALNWEHPLLREWLSGRAVELARLLGITGDAEDPHMQIKECMCQAIEEDLSLKESDLLQGLPGQSNLLYMGGREGVAVWRTPSLEHRYLHALAPLLDDSLTRHFERVVSFHEDRDSSMQIEDWPRALGPNFFEDVFSAAYSPSKDRTLREETLEAREAYQADHALAARWTQAREASRLIAYMKEDILHLLLGAFSSARRALDPITFLGPLRTVPERHFGGRRPHDGHEQASGASAWNLLREEADVRERVNAWMTQKLSMNYEVRLRQLFDEAQVEYRSDHARHMGAQGAASWLVGYLPQVMLASGITSEQITQVWAHVRNDMEKQQQRHRPPLKAGELRLLERELVDQVPAGLVQDPSWVANASATPSSAVDRLLSQARTLAFWEEQHRPEQPLPAAEELNLFDRRNGVNVGARDVGLGVSQVLPVLVNAAAGTGRTVLIEQPELHLHPALQAELADVLVESVRERQHTFVLETHSEHLILRLLRRIRETTDPEVNHEPALYLTVDDLAVLYASPSNEGTRIEDVALTPDGDFEHHWPPGFFADRSRELF